MSTPLPPPKLPAEYPHWICIAVFIANVLIFIDVGNYAAAVMASGMVMTSIFTLLFIRLCHRAILAHHETLNWNSELIDVIERQRNEIEGLREYIANMNNNVDHNR